MFISVSVTQKKHLPPRRRIRPAPNPAPASSGRCQGNAPRGARPGTDQPARFGRLVGGVFFWVMGVGCKEKLGFTFRCYEDIYCWDKRRTTYFVNSF